MIFQLEYKFPCDGTHILQCCGKFSVFQLDVDACVFLFTKCTLSSQILSFTKLYRKTAMSAAELVMVWYVYFFWGKKLDECEN